MVQITIDTEKSSKEDIVSTIEFLQKLVSKENYPQMGEDIEIITSHSQPENVFNNSLPSSEPLRNKNSANDLLNMFDSDEEEIKPKKDLADFSQFMPY